MREEVKGDRMTLFGRLRGGDPTFAQAQSKSRAKTVVVH